MSLKAVHLIFVTVLSALALGTAALKLRSFLTAGGAPGDLLFAIGALVAAVLVVAYGRYFLKKLSSIGYL